MTQPVPKSSIYFEQISRMIKNNLKFNELDFKRFQFEISKIDSIASRFELLGWAHAIQGNQSEAISSYKSALSSTFAGFHTNGNYYLLLKRFGLYREALEFGKTISVTYNDPDFLNDFFLENIVALDVDGAQTVFDKLRRMNKLDLREFMTEASKEMDLMHNLSSGFISKDQLLALGKVVLEVAEEHKCILIGNRVRHNKESNHLSISYALDCKMVTSDQLFDVNLALFENLISSNLDSLPAVVQFVRLNKSESNISDVSKVLKAEGVTDAS
ncbi:hypothetical protein HGO26_16655 [Shewanella sp. S-1]|uniref:Tetratricopeptide repeat protein n=1 Tax=Shewanella oncorhynchi TaxID=2726434 RepID=A0ABX1KQP3_9GAMM|nr:hypothetical protein [Shewanella oncorhynchi]NLQ24502.1 hypothetical protein [Shewanella oncorhynchi]